MKTQANVKPASNTEVLQAFDDCETQNSSLSIALQKSRIELAAAKATLRKMAAIPGVPVELLKVARLQGGH